MHHTRWRSRLLRQLTKWSVTFAQIFFSQGLITKIVKRGDGNNISDITTVMVGKQTDHVLKGQKTGPSCGIRI